MSRYRGPAGVILTEDEWFIVYVILLSHTAPHVTAIRSLIKEYLHYCDHPSVRDEPNS